MQTIGYPSALACKTGEAIKFAELAARAGLEPDLAQRYATDPVGVLAEFGLSAAEPLYLCESLIGDSILIEELDTRSDEAAWAGDCGGTFCVIVD